jgi:signal peptidase II
LRFATLARYAALAACLVGLDQWVKHLVETRLPYQEAVGLAPFLALYRTYNTGIAFSLLSRAGDGALLAIAAGVIAFVLWLAWRTDPRDLLARLGFTFIVAGAIGNVIDRAAYGNVVDYVLFHTPVWSFAVFNLADAFITAGAGLVILDEVVKWLAARRGGASRD